MPDSSGIQFSPVQERIITWLIIGACAVACITLMSAWAIVIVLSLDELRRQLLALHFVAIVGVPGISAAAFLLVMVFRQIEGPIEFEFLSVKFKGASGPIIMWAITVWTVAGAVKMVW
jgi:hypothetical protein